LDLKSVQRFFVSAAGLKLRQVTSVSLANGFKKGYELAGN